MPKIVFDPWGDPISLPNEYEKIGYREFWNGREHMVEVWGTCRADGQYVRYFQKQRFFDLRVDLYEDGLARLVGLHPRRDAVEILESVASEALAQSRERWSKREA